MNRKLWEIEQKFHEGTATREDWELYDQLTEQEQGTADSENKKSFRDNKSGRVVERLSQRLLTSSLEGTTRLCKTLARNLRIVMLILATTLIGTIYAGYRWTATSNQLQELNRKLDLSLLPPDQKELAHLYDDNNVTFAPLDQQPEGRATIKFINTGFQCKFDYLPIVGKHFHCIVDPGESLVDEFVATGDPVTIFVRPRAQTYWYQPFSITIVNKEGEVNYMRITAGKALVRVVDGDQIVVRMEQPVPPWNAVIIYIDKIPVLVTLMHPYLHHRPKRLHGNANPNYPNCPTFWAEFGDKGMARSLATAFVSNRNKVRDFYFSFEDHLTYTSMIIPCDQNGVDPTLREISQEELEKHLVSAFQRLRLQHQPNGQTIQDEIDKVGK